MIFMLFLCNSFSPKTKFAFQSTLKNIETFWETRHLFCALIIISITVYREKLPFVRPAPIDEQEAKKQKKQGGGMKDKSKNVTDAVDKMAIGDN